MTRVHRTLCYAAVAAAFAFGGPAAAQQYAEIETESGSSSQRATFEDWTVDCRSEDTCGVLTYDDRGDQVDGPRHALRVQPARSGRGFDLYLISFRSYVGDRSPISATVDRRRVGAWRRDVAGGWSQVEGIRNEYRIFGRTVSDRVLPAMRRGFRLRLDYVDAQGVDRRANFSLAGLTAALRAFDERRF